jgi:hypothetical protein
MKQQKTIKISFPFKFFNISSDRYLYFLSANNYSFPKVLIHWAPYIWQQNLYVVLIQLQYSRTTYSTHVGTYP